MYFLPLLFLILFGSAVRAKEPFDWQLGFQAPSSDVMRSVLSLHDFVLIMMTIITIFVLFLIIYVVIRFRRKARRGSKSKF